MKDYDFSIVAKFQDNMNADSLCKPSNAIKEFNPSDYLTDQQTIQAYIDEAASTGEPAIIADALAIVSQVKGMDNTLHPRDNPSLSSLIGLANVLGISVRLGINIK
ncbi:TPA: DNA-binding protein [Vibrio diabolicus]